MDSECLVCGKQFPRGSLDLLRHSNAVTLKHQISKKQSSTFRHSCPFNCGLYFLKKDHLNLHRQIVCGSKAKAKRISLQYLTSTYDSFITKKRKKENETNQIIPQVIVKRKKVSKSEKNNIHNNEIDDNDVREQIGLLESEPINPETTLECMVCGKLFPRSNDDLQRHMTGKELNMLYISYHDPLIA